MSTDTETSETNIFALVLLLDPATTRRIERLRGRLLASPIRSDVPHLVLIRGISSAEPKTDAELLHDLKPAVLPLVTGSYLAGVDGLATVTGRAYGQSTVLRLDLHSDFAEQRQQILDALEAKDYQVEPSELRPVVMVSLGVALPDDLDTSDLFPPDHQIEFVDFALLRLSNVDGAVQTRLVRGLF